MILAPLVQKRWMALSNGYIAQLVFLIFIHWIVINPVDSAIQFLNNWGLLDSVMGRNYIEASGYVVGKIHSQIKPVVSLVWFMIFVCFLAVINQKSRQRKFWFKLGIDFTYSRYIIRSGTQQTLFLFRTNQSENGNFRAF